MTYDVGALVRARGREWVVLPESRQDPDLLVLRPLGGTEAEVTGIYLPLETVEAATFSLPDPVHDLGNQLSGGLLRDAVRLGFRSGAGPFRSLARIAVEPRPYQLVPLLLALKLDPIRLLIADDVGIGKTVEACLIARELLDRAEVSRLTVLCPPHLAEQWKKALREQFHIDAELVLSGTAARLERACRGEESLFERYPFTVVSTDYIKGERRRHEFLRTCPELVIVDEAHGCAGGRARSASQKRHALLRDLVDPEREASASRHLLLVTATPHSGNDEAFRSLITLLNPDFHNLPDDLSGDQNRSHRDALARHLVQRRRGDLKAALGTSTPFPDREIAEDHYSLSKEHSAFLQKLLRYCRESVLDEGLEKRRQRVRWWSALALLRAFSSSPMAAAATLRNRSGTAEAETVEQVDDEGRRLVLDLDEEETEGIDVIPGSEPGEEPKKKNDRLLKLAREAEELAGAKDKKLTRAVQIVEALLEEGYSPILFCRFIPTVEYVADYLRKKLGKKGVNVEAVTGQLPADERERRIDALAAATAEGGHRVLVCTDCLSEGINLQHAFDAVVHYDLAWNPTRHEQREGRVDRYGQKAEKVRTLTFYGKNNPVDGIVLDVLLRKHKKIHKQLGTIVPVPMNTQVIEDAIFQGLLMREHADDDQQLLEFMRPELEAVELEWDTAVEREKRSRTLFAQNQLLKAVNNEVRAELQEVRRALGSQADVEQFTTTATKILGGTIGAGDPLHFDVKETPRALRDAIGQEGTFLATFDPTTRGAAHALTRTHPIVEGLAAHVLESALDSSLDSPARRAAVIRTSAVESRTTLLLLRLRFHIVNQGRDGKDRPLLAEDLVLAAFTGSPAKAEWLDEDTVEPLLTAEVTANIGTDQARDAVQRVLDGFDDVRDHLDKLAEERGAALLDAHGRVRKATRSGVKALQVEVHKPADVLGVYIYLPAPAGGAA